MRFRCWPNRSLRLNMAVLRSLHVAWPRERASLRGPFPGLVVGGVVGEGVVRVLAAARVLVNPEWQLFRQRRGWCWQCGRLF